LGTKIENEYLICHNAAKVIDSIFIFLDLESFGL